MAIVERHRRRFTLDHVIDDEKYCATINFIIIIIIIVIIIIIIFVFDFVLVLVVAITIIDLRLFRLFQLLQVIQIQFSHISRGGDRPKM